MELRMNRVVEKIFDTMMGCVCLPVGGVLRAADVWASVTFGRVHWLECEVTLGFADADELVRMLTGEANESLRADAAGELCNMIAGGWVDRSYGKREVLMIRSPRTGIGEVAERSEDAESEMRFSGVYSFGNGRFRVRLRRVDAS